MPVVTADRTFFLVMILKSLPIDIRTFRDINKRVFGGGNARSYESIREVGISFPVRKGTCFSRCGQRNIASDIFIKTIQGKSNSDFLAPFFVGRFEFV